MKIGFDAKRYFHNFSGLGNYSRDLVNGIINNHCYFSFCRPDFGVFMNRQDLDSFVKLSNDSLLIHGFLRQTFITNDIVQLIKSFYHIICLKNCDDKFQGNIMKRYNFTDLSNNLIGPIIKTYQYENLEIIVAKTEFDGLYSFEKSTFYSQTRMLNKVTTEWQIIVSSRSNFVVKCINLNYWP